jgi:two-component system sensor histidine kinase KdpD
MNTFPNPLADIRPSPTLAQQVLTYAKAAGVVALTTLGLWALRDRLTPANASLVYMLATIVVAVWLGTYPAILAAVLSFFGFNLFLLQPYYTLAVEDTRELLDLLIFLAAGLIAGRLAGYAREQADTSRQVSAEQVVLYRLTSTLNQLNDHAAILEELRRVAVEEIGATQLDILPEADGRVTPSGPALYLLLNAGDTIFGTVRAAFPSEASPAQRRLLTACVVQSAIALQRVELAEQAQRSEALGEADALKTALLRAVSHDLRTPITIIKSSAANLHEFGPDLPAAQQRELAQTIESEADRLNRLVGNLLDMSRLQAGALVLNTEWNSLEEIAGDVAAQTYNSLGEERLVLDFPEDLPLLRCDYELIVQALGNIVENALRYEPDGRRAILSGSVASGDSLELAVINHGATISEEDKARVMEPFFQAGDGRSVVGRVGLGLAIARGIIEAHHGRLTIHDTPGGGATFVIHLPREDLAP